MTRTLTLILALAALLAQPVVAFPRITGRLVKVNAQKRIVVFQRADGKMLRAAIRKDAVVRRLGTDTTMATFRPGDYVVVEVVGPLNDVPLDSAALMDTGSAGRAPSAIGSAPNTPTGTFATAGGPAAPMPFPQQPSVGAQTALGGSQPAVPGVGQYDVNSKPAQPDTQPGPGVGAYGPIGAGPTSQTIQIPPQNPKFPAPPTSATYTASPSPANSPWTGQVIAQGGVTPAPPPNSVSPPRAPTPILMPQQPQQAPPNPNVLISGEESPSGANPGIPDVVSIQGNVTQVDLGRRMFYVQAMLAGRPQMVAVVVPPQVQMLSARTQQAVGFDTLRVGDFVILQGIQSIGGAIEARTRIFINP